MSQEEKRGITALCTLKAETTMKENAVFEI
jgi:hypothetical protein